MKKNISSQPYYLLPFRFKVSEEGFELLINEFGDYLTVPSGTLVDLITKKISKGSSIYCDLLANYFISEDLLPKNLDVLATRYRTMKSFINSFTGLHIIVMTLRCNNKCIYCQVTSKNKSSKKYDITYDILDRSILLIFQSPNKYITVEFQGGEPLLVFDKIKYTVEKIEAINLDIQKSITYVICTNLMIISEEILHYCKIRNILISTSLDGPQEVHDSNRCSGNYNYKRTIANIKHCQEYLGYERVSALMTTTRFSLSKPKEIVDEYYRLGFKNIFLRPINPYGLAVSNFNTEYSTEEFLRFYKIALEVILEYNLKGNLFIEDYTRIFLDKIITPFSNGFVDLQSPSGLIINVIVYNYNGDLFPSDEARMLAEMGDPYFKLGNVLEDSYKKLFYGRKAKNIVKDSILESQPICNDCAYLPYCGADPVKNYLKYGDLIGYKINNEICQRNIEIIEHLFNLLQDKSIEKVFLRWTA